MGRVLYKHREKRVLKWDAYSIQNKKCIKMGVALYKHPEKQHIKMGCLLYKHRENSILKWDAYSINILRNV